MGEELDVRLRLNLAWLDISLGVVIQLSELATRVDWDPNCTPFPIWQRLDVDMVVRVSNAGLRTVGNMVGGLGVANIGVSGLMLAVDMLSLWQMCHQLVQTSNRCARPLTEFCKARPCSRAWACAQLRYASRVGYLLLALAQAASRWNQLRMRAIIANIAVQMMKVRGQGRRRTRVSIALFQASCAPPKLALAEFGLEDDLPGKAAGIYEQTIHLPHCL